MTRQAALLVCIAVLAACSDPIEPVAPSVATPQASALVLTFGPHGGAPFFAISGNGGFIPTDGTWAAIPFHRDLACVPSSANLLTLAIPAAFDCTLTVEGHEHWENGPGIDPAPRQTVATGLGAVPIVFASWSAVQGAISDGVLTLPELLGLQGAMVGTATSYHEVDIFGVSGPLGAGRGMYKINARGSLSDGRSFRLTVNEVLGEQRTVVISFN